MIDDRSRPYLTVAEAKAGLVVVYGKNNETYIIEDDNNGAGLYIYNDHGGGCHHLSSSLSEDGLYYKNFYPVYPIKSCLF